STGRHPAPRLARLLGVFRAFSVKFDPSGSVALNVDVEPIHGIADSGRFADDLAALLEVLGEAARDLGIGVLLLVDELQEAPRDELAALNTAVHHIGQSAIPLPVTFVGAGLPSLPAQLAEATSYAERLYDYRPIGLLTAQASQDALIVPAQNLGVDWTPDGLDAAVATARGYPYFLQSIGKHVWDNARRSPITIEDVEVGLTDARQEVDDGLYRSRWERATPAQREVLRVLARLGGDGAAATADIAKAMGRRLSDISAARNEVIKKGLAYAPERGLLAFTVPGMHDFIDRQP
ncbi:MAG: ATP-binding protein, partial [Actinomycetota bacterium]|nr:ATP-binding protein [Actinomycetota bacterium]